MMIMPLRRLRMRKMMIMKPTLEAEAKRYRLKSPQ
jgi:hypothetical protein